MVKVTGKLLPKFQKLRAGAKDAVFRALVKTMEGVAADAKKSIKQGAISGRAHIASRPGEPPNEDTGRLTRGIKVVKHRGRNAVQVVSEAPYAGFLEFGTSRMAERPYLRPALRRGAKKIAVNAKVEINKLVR